VGHEREGGWAVLAIVLAVAVVVAGGWVAAYAGATGKVPLGTHVAGVDIGGRDKYAASATLASAIRPQLAQPITVQVGTVTAEVTPAEAGISVDSVATVRQVVGKRSWDPRRIWSYYSGGDATTPVVKVDAGRMNALFDRLDEQAGQPARNAGISLSGGAVSLTEPRDGAQLDRDAAASALVQAYVAGRTSVRLPLRLVAPDIDGAELESAVQTLANPAVSAPVTLTFAGSPVVLQPRQYADLLSIVSRGGALTLDVDSGALAALVDPTAHDVEPVDASISLQGGVPTVVPAKTGEAFDEAGVTAAFLAAVTAQGPARTVAVEPAGTSEANFTDADAQALGVTTPVASFAVPVPASAGAALSSAAARLDGTLLKPGDSLSLRGRTGEVSGSVSRLATATWNAGFLAGLTDVARTGSPTYAAGLPVGRDAFVDSTADLVMRNDTVHGVLLSARVADGQVVVDAWSTKEWEVGVSVGAPYAPVPRTTVTDASPSCVASAGADGFSVDLARTFTDLADPSRSRSDTVTTTYQPQPAVVCQAVPPPA
jgi:vancomycin resistance protein YoaR